MGGPLFSIIIPCKNEGGHIQETLQSINDSSSQKNYEIIVVDDASSDGCCEFLKGGQEGITLLHTQNLYANRARNLGAKKARGSILVFCDAHIFLEKDWLEKLGADLERPGVDAVSPCLRPHDYKGTEAWGGVNLGAGTEYALVDPSKRIKPGTGINRRLPCYYQGSL